MWAVVLTCIFAVVNSEGIEEVNKEAIHRDSKLSIFQVVKFANSECSGSTKNGTCYTKAECETIGGTASGSCADGFGVCCLVTITTGQTSSTNNSYISLTSDISSGSHTYTICPCSDDICRIKFDFNTFTLEGPISVLGTVTQTVVTEAQQASFEATGQCNIDTFQIISPSGRSSPLICGDNDNQHMILETCGSECLTVRTGIGAGSSVTRSLDIRVMQYRCGDEMGGPSGCLQYFQNTSGKIRSFNFPDVTPGATIPYNYVHLANQHYKTCVRRGNGMEVICYIACTSIAGEDENTGGTAVDAQPSFGLSLSPNAISKSAVSTNCSKDYIWIPLGLVSTQFTTVIAQQDTYPEATDGPVRFCGRYFATSVAGEGLAFAGLSVCSYAVPFEVGVDFDDDEACWNNATADQCEGIVTKANVGGGGGILGFSLCYVQSANT